jgi:hypothetical protein
MLKAINKDLQQWDKQMKAALTAQSACNDRLSSFENDVLVPQSRYKGICLNPCDVGRETVYEQRNGILGYWYK